MDEQMINNLSDKAKYDYDLVIRAVENNDQKAYTEILSRYKDSIYYMMYKMVKNEEDAEDLTIEAFGKAFKKIDQYSPNFAFSTWLFKIASNNCIDFIRKKKKLTVSIDKGSGEKSFEIEDAGLTPDKEFIKMQKVEIMRDVVLQLKPRYRDLIELRYFKELSYEEISEELDLPLGTVKAQLFRAKELLFNILKDRKDSI